MSRRLRRSPTLRWYRLGSRPQLLIKSGDPAGNLGENYQLGTRYVYQIFFLSEKIFPSSVYVETKASITIYSSVAFR